MARQSHPRRSRAAHSQGKRATIADVARHAGVGTVTVSRVLREPGKVSNILQQRVMTAIDQLGYISNQVASGLASGASRIVPVIIPTLAHTVFVPFLDGVHTELDLHGYEVLLGTTEYREEVEARLVSTFLGWFPRGFLIAGIDHSEPTVRRLMQAVSEGTPVVEYMDLAETPLDMNIGVPHRAIGEAAARHLAGRGYRRVGYAGTLTAIDRRGQRRLAGFMDTLRDLGLPDSYVVQADEPFSIGLGARLMAELLDRYPDVDAVLMTSDDLVVGASAEVRRRGLNVPQDIGLMGIGDVEIASMAEPSITSVNIELRAMGQLAAQHLVAACAGERPQQRSISTPFRIVERASTNRR